MAARFDPSRKTLFVCSHPNHELAVYGHAQRLRPHFVFLTDGGGPERVADTRAGLDRIGLLDRARFLDHTEAEFYAALVQRDPSTYATVARQVWEAVTAVDPEQVVCDAVEYYNPVHDVALPVVLRALDGQPERPVFEMPLIHQTLEAERRYVMQRVSERRRPACSALQLTGEELEQKCFAMREVYGELRAQLGDQLDALSREHIAREELVPAAWPPAEPGRDVALRYERRGELLRERGDVATVITHAGHYLPVVEALIASS